MPEHYAFVATPIFAPSAALQTFAEGCTARNWGVFVAGDKKSPPDFALAGATYLAADADLPFRFSALCPFNHYGRKNIGYLAAIAEGADVIVESDDDNIPYDSFFAPRSRVVEATAVQETGWVNVYSRFTEKKIWPRGLPLAEVARPRPDWSAFPTAIVDAPIQQGLADVNPDVDALYRLIEATEVSFDAAPPIALGHGAWSPFNSQNTTWWRDAFPLLYLPFHCSFRMTDIWRSFVAQRLAWTCGWSVLYHRATVWQDRNAHDLMRDFADEVPGYLHNQAIRETLDALPLKSGPENLLPNLANAYAALVGKGWISEAELPLVEAWCLDVEALLSRAAV